MRSHFFFCLILPCAIAGPYKFPLFPFGENVGDQVLDRGDDTFETTTLFPPKLPFFNHSYSSVYVSVNGAVSFNKGISEYTPICGPLSEEWAMISPFWADVDLLSRSDPQGGGSVSYRQSTNSSDLVLAERYIRKAYFSEWQTSLQWVFIATWNNVSNYKSPGRCTVNARTFIPRNTFQLILATNGRKAWTIFLYPFLEWTTGSGSSSGGDCTGLGGTAARAGFDTGDGKTFHKLKGSCVSDILKLQNESNIGEPGQWVFKVDNYFDDVSDVGCKPSQSTELKVEPLFASSGDILILSGPCVDNSSSLTSLVLPAVGLQLRVLAIDYKTSKIAVQLPQDESLSRLGRIEVELNITRSNGTNPEEKYKGHFYTSSRIPEISVSFSRKVNEPINNFLLLVWNPSQFGSSESQITIACCGIRNGNESIWAELLSPPLVARNNGSNYLSLNKAAILEIPETHLTGLDFYLSPGSFVQGRQRRSLNSMVQAFLGLHPTLKAVLDYGVRPLTARFPLYRNYWDIVRSCSGILPVATCLLDPTGYARRMAEQRCNEWHQRDPGVSLDTHGLERCAPTDAQMRVDDRFREDHSNYFVDIPWFHPGMKTSFRQKTPAPSGAANQCVYDRSGKLMSTGVGRSTVDAGTGFWSHIEKDVAPFGDCCKFSDNCDKYFEKRPADNGDAYDRPRLARSVGDPHLSTLDGQAFMFNGKGEYWMIWRRDHDDGFEMQVRFEQMGRGSIATAFVMNSSEVDLVQVESASDGGIDVLLGGKIVEFGSQSDDSFDSGSVVVESSKRRQVVVSYTSGHSFTFSRSGRSLNVVAIVSFSPLSTGSLGLWGQFDTIPGNDFMPRNSTSFLPANATAEALHYQFGLTWMVLEDESMFTYREGRNYTTYYDPDFIPYFQTPAIQNNDNANAQAVALCGNSSTCIFDYVATQGDAELALGTRSLFRQVESLESAFGPLREANRQVPSTTTTTPKPKLSHDACPKSAPFGRPLIPLWLKIQFRQEHIVWPRPDLWVRVLTKGNPHILWRGDQLICQSNHSDFDMYLRSTDCSPVGDVQDTECIVTHESLSFFTWSTQQMWKISLNNAKLGSRVSDEWLIAEVNISSIVLPLLEREGSFALRDQTLVYTNTTCCLGATVSVTISEWDSGRKSPLETVLETWMNGTVVRMQKPTPTQPITTTSTATTSTTTITTSTPVPSTTLSTSPPLIGRPKRNISMIPMKLHISLSNLPETDEGFWPLPDPYTKIYMKNFHRLYWDDDGMVIGRMEKSYILVEKTQRYWDRRDVEWTMTRAFPFYPSLPEQIFKIEIWDEDIQFDDKMYDVEVTPGPFILSAMREKKNLTKEDPAVVINHKVQRVSCCGQTTITVKAYEVEDEFRNDFP